MRFPGRFRIFLPLVSAFFAAAGEKPVAVPYVILVSLDGFRPDYAERYQAKNLLAIGNVGVSAQALIPSFPTLTFPNHLAIVTGLYPGHHGIVSNTFYDPAQKEEYSMKKTAANGSWYSGTPLWVLAESQHVKTAAMFWPGTEAEIGGYRPSYFKPYDDNFPNDSRVETVVNWLKLPEDQRPHLITLYFSDVDTAGHKFGPESAETEAAVQNLDALLGTLRKGIAATGLTVNLLVVSDHGMQATNNYINLAEYIDVAKVRLVTDGPLAMLYTADQRTTTETYRALKGKSTRFDVYLRAQTPSHWHIRDSIRSGDVFVMAREPAAVLQAAPLKPVSKGMHGFDPAQYPSMRGIFYAAGPNIREHRKIKPFENVNIYPFIAELMGLKITGAIDGSAKVLHGLLQPQPNGSN